ncbi:hypothetical protein [Ferruginibacter albus]|uniref:hypothetical protein n=1 Tax=Ferruginibacter albus TaxID=2875540 RepID=UPI001CC55294|nr:hypothetical protein [Ferruginibacter albus]UAY53094.1 hypothetical protein K9M53_05300 [Ferruginibacter albus]
MKITLQPLIDFITDFNLNTAEVVSFNAKICFSSTFFSTIVEGNVEIINIHGKNINVVYLLGEDIEKYGVPNMFEDEHHKIEYQPNDCVIVKGRSESFDNYTIKIYPEKMLQK